MRTKLTLQRPGVLQRAWYRRLGLTPPLSETSSGPWHAHWVRLLPYRWRRLHRAYATANGYYWLPCILCGRPYGGHEGGTTIPDPTRGPGQGIVICSRCTIKRPQ
jgi:hypothetical protein